MPGGEAEGLGGVEIGGGGRLVLSYRILAVNPRPVFFANSASAFAVAADRIARSWSRGMLSGSCRWRTVREAANRGQLTSK